jgi:hypothetical protein
MSVPAPARFWDGTPRGAGALSLVLLSADTGAAGAPPAPVLAGVHDGSAGLLLRPQQLGPFLRLHAGAHLACHDAADLHRVLRRHLTGVGDEGAVEALWGFSRDCRLYDVGLLDQLVQLAEEGPADPSPRPSPIWPSGTLGSSSWTRPP